MCSNNQQFSLNQALSLGVQQIQPISWTIGVQTQAPIEPRPLDILCGKSKRCVDHGGSRRFRTVIECYREKYQQALTKWDKTSVTRTIYDNLSQAGSRFLKYNDALKIWEEISPMAARDKIGHALRFANRVTRRKRSADCIGSKAILPAITTTTATATTTPQPLQVSQSSPFPSLPSQPLATKAVNIQQLPPLGSVATGIRSVPQLQVLGVSSGAALSAPSAPAPSAPTSILGQLQQPGMLTQSTFAPLERSEKWYQETENNALKIKAKPAAATTLAPAAEPTAAISPAAVLFDDSFSLLDDILPLLQNAQDPSPPVVANDNLEIDFDFDAEIMSVLF